MPGIVAEMLEKLRKSSFPVGAAAQELAEICLRFSRSLEKSLWHRESVACVKYLMPKSALDAFEKMSSRVMISRIHGAGRNMVWQDVVQEKDAFRALETDALSSEQDMLPQFENDAALEHYLATNPSRLQQSSLEWMQSLQRPAP